nr:hypothetical protein [uncultured Cohaesibacter sp.]
MASRNKSLSSTSLEYVAQELNIKPSYPLPGMVCNIIHSMTGLNGPATRILIALLWFSSHNLRRDVIPPYRIYLGFLRKASGFAAYRSNCELIKKIHVLIDICNRRAELESDPLLHTIRFVKEEGVDYLEWDVQETIKAEMIAPSNYAYVELRDIVEITDIFDIKIYLKATIVKNMSNKQFILNVDTLKEEYGISRNPAVTQKVQRSVSRLNKIIGYDLIYSVKKKKYLNKNEKIVISIRNYQPDAKSSALAAK